MGFFSSASISSLIFSPDRRTFSGDATYFQGIGPQYYVTKYELVVQDENNHVFPVFFSHFMGAKQRVTWKRVFEAVAHVYGFDEEGHVIIFNQENSINSSYKLFMKVFNTS